MENVQRCPICGNTTSQFELDVTDKTVSNVQFQIRSCKSCNFWFTSPRPTKEEIGDFYLSPDYTSHVKEAKGLNDHIYHFIRKLAIRNKFKLIRPYHSGGNVLDLGCGTGDFLAFLMTKGYSCLGIEPNPQAQAIAKSKNLNVISHLSDIATSHLFDVITLWHVLEHVHNPKETLETLHKITAKDGTIIIAVPDRESWDAMHYGANWAALDVPRHLSHFRQQDVQRLLNETGFENIASRKMWFDAPYVSMLSEAHLGDGPLLALVKGAVVGELSNLTSIINSRPTSSTLYIAKKRQGR